jgi:hypothetical protein
MVNVPRVWQWKTGITGVGVSKRAAGIDREMPGFPLPVAFCVTPFAYQIEQALHELYRPLFAPFYRGSGWTEWFLPPSAVLTFSVILLINCAQALLVDYLFGTRILPAACDLVAYLVL